MLDGRRIAQCPLAEGKKFMCEMLDCVGVPEFFVTSIGKVEPAGGGCVRIYYCIERGNNLIPQYTAVIPALSLLAVAKVAERAALEAFNREQMSDALAH